MHNEATEIKHRTLLDQLRSIGATITCRDWGEKISIDRNYCQFEGLLYSDTPDFFIFQLISTKLAHRKTGSAREIMNDVLWICDDLHITCLLDAVDLYTASMPLPTLVAWYERLGFTITRRLRNSITMRRFPREKPMHKKPTKSSILLGRITCPKDGYTEVIIETEQVGPRFHSCGTMLEEEEIDGARFFIAAEANIDDQIEHNGHLWTIVQKCAISGHIGFRLVRSDGYEMDLTVPTKRIFHGQRNLSS